MENTDAFNLTINRSFLFWWVLTNIIALPTLLIPYRFGEFLSMGLVVLADGSSVGSVVYIVGFIVLALSGAIVGAWFGFLQWLVVRKYISQAGKWVTASSIGLSIGTPLSWWLYGLFLFSPIVNRPNKIYFSVGYAYVIFGIVLGLAIGIAQSLILRRQTSQAGWWMLVLPICFTVGISSANFYRLWGTFAILNHQFTQRLAMQFPGIELSNMQVLRVFAVLSALIALVGVGLITGVVLKWLLRFNKRVELQQ
jgi:hypothetical protein